MAQSNWVHLERCRITKSSDAALFVVCDDLDWSGWLPRSQISNPDVFEVGDVGVTVSVTVWIAREKGIEVES